MYLIILVPGCILPVYSSDSLLSSWIKFPLLTKKKKKKKEKEKEKKNRSISQILVWIPIDSKKRKINRNESEVKKETERPLESRTYQ